MLLAAGTVAGIDTASIERLNATSSGTLGTRSRRGRATAHAEGAPTAGMYLVGCAYNFCRDHDGLRQAGDGEGLKGQAQMPAMAAGLTGHRWTMRESLRHPICLPPRVAPGAEGVHSIQSR